MPIRVHFGAPHSGLDARQMTVTLATPLLAGTGVECIGGQWELLEQSVEHFSLRAGPWHFVAISAPLEGKLDALSQQLYHRLFAAMQEAHLVRVWNFVPSINGLMNDLDNYQAFCQGRHEAFSNVFGEQAPAIYSAASAVGVEDARLTLYALATTLPIGHLENPLQIPAYEYPLKYGPRPPSFCRASIVPGTNPAVFISGTSAVRGSDSVGMSLREQLQITEKNLQQIIFQCEEKLGLRLSQPSQMRVYIRHAADLAAVKDWTATWGSAMTCNVIRSDICRRELLVEVEVSWLGATSLKHP